MKLKQFEGRSLESLQVRLFSLFGVPVNPVHSRSSRSLLRVRQVKDKNLKKKEEKKRKEDEKRKEAREDEFNKYRGGKTSKRLAGVL